MADTTRGYKIDNRELIAESAGLRVQILTVGAGQCVPWHHHTDITDTLLLPRWPDGGGDPESGRRASPGSRRSLRRAAEDAAPRFRQE